MAGRNTSGLSASENRRFALAVGGAFLALAALGFWRGHTWLLYGAAMLGGLLLFAGLVVPGHLGPVNRAWMAFAEAISRVTTPVVMGLIYLLVLTPIAILRRILGGNPVDHETNSGSYWVERDSPRSDLDRQF